MITTTILIVKLFPCSEMKLKHEALVFYETLTLQI